MKNSLAMLGNSKPEEVEEEGWQGRVEYRLGDFSWWVAAGNNNGAWGME